MGLLDIEEENANAKPILDDDLCLGGLFMPPLSKHKKSIGKRLMMPSAEKLQFRVTRIDMAFHAPISR